MRALVARLSDADLARSMPDGWTVAAVLAHMAFWDRRAAVMVERWQREGRAPGPDDGAAEPYTVNEAAKPQWLALAPRAAANEALAAAEAANHALDNVSPELLRQIVEASPIATSRAYHRLEHLEQIEHALGT